MGKVIKLKDWLRKKIEDYTELEFKETHIVGYTPEKKPEYLYGQCGGCGNPGFFLILNEVDPQFIQAMECMKCELIAPVEIIIPDDPKRSG